MALVRATVSAEACVGSIDVSEVMVGIVVAMAQLDDGELQKEKKMSWQQSASKKNSGMNDNRIYLRLPRESPYVIVNIPMVG